MSDLENPKPVVFLSPQEFAVERVFPIRNLIGDPEELQYQDADDPDAQIGEDPTLTSRTDAEASVKVVADGNAARSKPGGIVPAPAYLPPPYPPIPPPESIRRLSQSGSDFSSFSTTSDGQGGRRRRTERSTLVPSTTGPPGILPGIISDNTKQTFYRCEDEPIHTPGAIQQYGALVALKCNSEGDLEVRIASENSRKLLEYGPEQLFALRSFLDILNPETREDMVARINHAFVNARSGENTTQDTHLDVFALSITLPHGPQRELWCALHISKGTQNLLICEFEDYSDVFYLEKLYSEKTLPRTPTATIDLEVHPVEMLKSTTRKSTPLRVLQIARRKKQSGPSSMDIFNAMTQAQQQLAGAKSVQQVLDIVVGLISELTGFHRVMFYRFDSQKNGCVDAELVNPQASADLFRGLHFPASDIPKQARELYKINRIRILYDRDAETARLVCREASDFEVPLDLSHSYLRAMSPIHLKYLANLGVRSSMSVSIVLNSDLWGLIACHGYGDVGIRVPLPIRELCRNIGECAATNIERLLMLQRIEARKPPSSTPPPQNPAGFIAASSADLLRVFGADFGLLGIQDEARAIGRLDPYREALAILAHLQHRRFTSVVASQNINQDFPDINYGPGIKIISGLLVIPLSLGGGDFLVFFKKGQLREIRWAGNPYEKITRAGSEYLEPRTSFRRWTETVIGMSTEWTEDQKETAAVLGLLYGRFIEIWRQKEAAGSNNRMTRLLIRNSSHEVRTPLNAIVNYLELALENPIDDNTREILTKAHKASRSLIYVIDDLLNLTKAEDGPITSPVETFDLGATVSEVITAFRKEAMRKSLDLTVSTHQGIPEMVKGDSSRLRQVLLNVTSNAFQHSVEGGIKVDIRPIRSRGDSSVIGITVQDVGIGMSEAQLDNLFQEFEQVADDDVSSMSSDTTPSSLQDASKPLGLGLAVVARYVRNMKGQIRVKSELGKGTIFGIELPFEHASTTPDRSPIRTPPSQMRLPRSMSNSSTNPPSRLPLLSQSKTTEDSLFMLPGGEDSPSSGTQPSSRVESNDPRSPSMSSISIEHFSSTFPFPKMESESSPGEPERRSLSVLIAEDNPINARLLTRRLQKLGHEVEVACDGQECHDHFAANPQKVDVILMDLQMPLVDGVLSTKMIRRYEKEVEELRRIRPRVSIIAVSASLTENSRFDYVQTGFDAWILKPIDFGRLDFLLQGIKTPELKRDAVYTPGHWERGGWFLL